MDNLATLRSEFRETLTKANAKASEWEGKEKEMPAEVASEISSLIHEAEALKAKVDMLKAKADLDAYAQEGTGPKTTQTPAPEAKQSGPFKSLGEQLVAIANAGMPAGKTDHRLYEVKTASGLSEASEGGYLLQPEFTEEIFRKAFDSGQILSRVKKIPTTKNAVKFPALVESSRADGSRWGGIRAYWAAEADQKTKSKPSFENISLELKKLIGLCYVTDEMLQDLPVLQTLISDLFTEEFTFQLEEAIFNGSGSGEPLGVLKSPALVQIAEEQSQANTILFPNIVNMWSRMYSRSRLNAVWFINQDIEPKLYSMVLEGVSSSVPVYLPANGISGSPYGTLMGRPVIPTEHNPTLGSLGDILLADLSQYAAIDAGTLKTDTSIHVRFDYDETAFRFVYRFDGAPLWKAAMTPFKGSNTVSPFVAIAAGH